MCVCVCVYRVWFRNNEDVTSMITSYNPMTNVFYGDVMKYTILITIITYFKTVLLRQWKYNVR